LDVNPNTADKDGVTQRVRPTPAAHKAVVKLLWEPNKFNPDTPNKYGQGHSPEAAMRDMKEYRCHGRIECYP